MKKLIYFSAPWCTPCKVLGPVMEEVAQEANVQKINIDNSPEISSHYGIRSIPAVVLIDGMGNEVTRRMGVHSKQAYLDMYNQN